MQQAGRFFPSAFVVAAFCIALPPLAAGEAVPADIQAEAKRHFELFSRKAQMKALKETPIMVGDVPVGLALDLDMDFPTSLLTVPAPSNEAKQASFCDQGQFNNANFQVAFISSEGPYQRSHDAAFLKPFHLALTCAPSGSDADSTALHASMTAFPPRTAYVQPDGDKICLSTQGENFDPSWNSLIWTIGIADQSISVGVSDYKLSEANSKIADQVGAAAQLMTDIAFWKNAYAAMTPEYLAVHGFGVCDDHFPGSEQAQYDPGLLACYCRQGH